MPKITVIMPSLNVVKYIRPCMESVLKQTLEDIEILSIDAGSTDGTLEILQDYARKDSRIKVIHSDKRSYGYQVNLGISLAQGDYIGIVETDDRIVADMYEILYCKAVETEADYVKGRFEKFADIKQKIIWNMPMASQLSDTGLVGKVIESCNMPELLVRDIYLWTGIYSRDFVKQIKLNETPGAAFQDQGFLFQTISSAKRAVYLDKVVYQYRQDNGNSSIFNHKGFHYLVNEYTYIKKFLIGKNVRWKSVYYQRMFNQCIGRFEMMSLSGSYWEEAVEDIEILRGRLLKAREDGLLVQSDFTTKRWEMLEVFLQGAWEIYSYCAEQFRGMVEAVNAVFKVIDDKETVIFGSGKHGKFLHALIENRCPGLLLSYCDNNSELWGKEIQGIPVLSPIDVIRNYPDAVYMIANLRSKEAIRQQLYELGISVNKIGVFHEEPSMLMFQIPIK